MDIPFDSAFDFDLRRTIILGEYIKAWGLPKYRTVTSRNSHQVEVYCFPAMDGVVNRYATVGVSDCESKQKFLANWEFLMVLPTDNAGASVEEVSAYMLDFMAHTLRHGVKLEVGSAMDESALAPRSWAARGILIDEPRGEPEYLEHFHFGRQSIELFWLVPIHRSEYNSIVENGLDKFDAADQVTEWSVVDPRRESFI